MLYFKHNKRYYEVPEDMFQLYRDGIPTDGIWEIRDNGKSLHWVGELPNPVRIQLDQYREGLSDIMLSLLNGNDSTEGIVRKFLDRFSEMLLTKNNACKLKWTIPEIHQLGKAPFKLPLEVYVLYMTMKLNLEYE
jgi:hypothetical protein